MQDSKQTKTDAKQYFDIKGPSKPDPTSRPVINGEPIQSDPMMSETKKLVVVEDNSSPEPATPTETVEVKKQSEVEGPEPVSDIPILPGGSDPDAVEYFVPEPPKETTETPVEQPATDTSSESTLKNLEVVEASEAPKDDVAEVPATTNPIEQPLSESSSTPTHEISEHPAEAILNTGVGHVDTQPKAVAKKSSIVLKVIIAVVVIALLAAAFYFIHKYESGQ